jgi:murein L,D-transpeptidase YcbB/YkuD
MLRVRPLPGNGSKGRYILIDAAAARLWMYEDSKPTGSMRVIVGTPETPTPMMAAVLRFVSLNPYWNVPTELARSVVAKRVVAEGLGYLKERDYEVLSDWSAAAKPLDPATVDWPAVADGRMKVRLRRGPGPWNSMGRMKFMLPNYFGIYLHDVPDKSHFADEARWLSNGCVRLEDAERLAKWIFGRVLKAKTAKPEERVDLPQPIPVYVTYLTVDPGVRNAVFRSDPYDYDTSLMAQFAPAGGPAIPTP